MLVVIAQQEELKLVKELGYDKNPIIITGVGALNVINALKDIPKDTEILNIGFAGSNYFDVGTILQISCVNTYHEEANFEEPPKSLKYCFSYRDDIAACYTSTDFVTKTKKEEPCVFDMELAFIRALFPNTRAIKVVSDNLNKSQYDNNVN